MGGGTPSTLEPDLVGRIIRCINGTFNVSAAAEITIEVNPGTVSYDKLRKYHEFGINRLSIGLQSANDDELKALGRIHDHKQFRDTYEAAVRAGFNNINVDIMTAIPGQTMDSLTLTLKEVTGLDPKPAHISAYSLILEEGTPFYDKYASGEEGESVLFSEEEERGMYHHTVSFLKEQGYSRYEISNFSIPGMESKHNSAYWERRDYIGFGLAASSLVGNVRYKNTVSIDDYIKRPTAKDLFEEKIRLTREDCMSEFMFLGLRMNRGVALGDFAGEFGVSIEDIYGEELERLVNDGLLEKAGDHYRLTDRGVDYGNHVFSRFV